ncbi:MAG: hypothetical protein PHU25_04250 [Deltaproteobacteria bacterium]|nr:hypothetical protein [Deltaproteobacteria bacterium]
MIRKSRNVGAVWGIGGAALTGLLWLAPSSAQAGNKVILDVPNLAKVEADGAAKQLIITAAQPGKVPVEYSIWHKDGYVQSEAGGWATEELKAAVKKESFPAGKTFIVTVGRYKNTASAVCRETSGVVQCAALKATAANDTILTAPGVGKATVNGTTRKMTITASKPATMAVEYTLWHSGGYAQGEVGGSAGAAATAEVEFPHYATFIVTIGHGNNVVSAICRENDGQTGCALALKRPEGESIFDVTGFGKVAADTTVKELTFMAFAPNQGSADVAEDGAARQQDQKGDGVGAKPAKETPPATPPSGPSRGDKKGDKISLDYSVWSADLYKQAVLAGAVVKGGKPIVRKEPLPQYKTFIVTIGNRGKIAAAICREKGGKIGCTLVQ